MSCKEEGVGLLCHLPLTTEREQEELRTEIKTSDQITDQYPLTTAVINSQYTISPAPLPGVSLMGGGGLLLPCEGVGEAGGGGGAGPLVGVWPPGEGAVLLLLREL